MASRQDPTHWILELARGREIGHRYTLASGDTVLGNDLAGAAGFDMSGQEPSSPRRMAGRHACLTLAGGSLGIRDMESPGGTFVNRQRLLSGQTRALQPGDVIQMGGIQLVVKREAASPAPAPSPPPVPTPLQAEPRPQRQPEPPTQAKAGPLAVPFTIQGGPTCRSWDDFLTISAQRWSVMRDELTSGRIGAHLRRAGRTDLVPRLDPALSADEQLDAWLAQLPASRSSAPELEVHPPLLIVKGPGGGVIRKSLRVTNVGYRLLRSTARIEPPASTNLRIGAELASRSFATIDSTDLPVEITLPERGETAALGLVVIDSNGGTQKVEVRFERSVAGFLPADAFPATAAPDLLAGTRPLGERVSAQPFVRRLIVLPIVLVVFRLLVLAAGQIPIGTPNAGGFEPRLGSLALVLGAVGAVLASTRQRAGGDRLACGFSGAIAGVLAAAIGFAVVRGVEATLGSWAGSPVAALALWAVMGLLIALVSWLAFPPAPALSALPPEPQP